mgnify:CR=1 FL=1
MMECINDKNKVHARGLCRNCFNLASDIDSGLFVLNSTHLTIGVNETASENMQVNVYPNPFSTSVTVELNSPMSIGAKGDVTFKMYDVFGREVYHSPITAHRLLIERGNLSSGIYFYQIINNNQIIATGKLCAE